MTRNGKVALLASVAVTVGLVTAALALAGLGGAEDPKQAAPRSTFSLEQARAFADHALYYAGTSVDGLPLVAVLRDKAKAAALPDKAAAGDVVSFIYGDCIAAADTGCAPPAEVQIWPACVRSLALYDTSMPGTPITDHTTVRGVPAAFLDDGLRLEIHTGRSLVVVFADSQDRVGRIASALRGVNVAIPAEARLPAPVPGAVEGKLRC